MSIFDRLKYILRWLIFLPVSMLCGTIGVKLYLGSMGFIRTTALGEIFFAYSNSVLYACIFAYVAYYVIPASKVIKIRVPVICLLLLSFFAVVGGIISVTQLFDERELVGGIEIVKSIAGILSSLTVFVVSLIILCLKSDELENI